MTDERSPWRWVESAGLLVLRFGLGGVFVFSALVKLGVVGWFEGVLDPAAAGAVALGDVEPFARSIVKFELLDPARDAELIRLAAYTIPWLELIAGGLLVFGLLTRGSALLIGGLLVVFLGGIVSVVARGLSIECGCFGEVNIPCAGPVGTCHIVRNTVLLAVAAVLLWRGGGLIAAERLGVERLPRDRGGRPEDF